MRFKAHLLAFASGALPGGERTPPPTRIDPDDGLVEAQQALSRLILTSPPKGDLLAT